LKRYKTASDIETSAQQQGKWNRSIFQTFGKQRTSVYPVAARSKVRKHSDRQREYPIVGIAIMILIS